MTMRVRMIIRTNPVLKAYPGINPKLNIPDWLEGVGSNKNSTYVQFSEFTGHLTSSFSKQSPKSPLSGSNPTSA
jgi:hypothetical protein